MLVNSNLLSPLLIPPKEIKRLYKQVDVALRYSYPRFHIAIKDYSFIYRTPGIAYTWDNEYIYVQVRLPLSSYQSEYLIYKPTALSLPISQNHTHSLTKLRNLPELFAVSVSQDFYFELTEHQLHKCVGSFEKYCLQSFPVISSDIPSCISGIYWNQYKIIKDYCEIDFIQTTRPSQILTPIVGNKYLSVTSCHDIWYLSCGQLGPRHISPITFGYFSLNCNCGLRTNKYYLPPNIDGCHINTYSDLESENVANVLYLAKWLDHAQIEEMTNSRSNFDNLAKFDIDFPNISHGNFGPGYIPANHDLILDLDDVIKRDRKSVV